MPKVSAPKHLDVMGVLQVTQRCSNQHFFFKTVLGLFVYYRFVEEKENTQHLHCKYPREPGEASSDLELLALFSPRGCCRSQSSS